jgi:hypothetical protein
MDPVAEIAVLKEQIKVANKRIADLENLHETLIDISGTLRVATEQLKTMNSRLDTHDRKFELIETGPAQDMAKIRLGVIISTICLIVSTIWDKVM